MLIILLGRPGSGKTTVARAFARRTGAVHLRVDTIEQAIRSAGSGYEVGEAGYVVAYQVAADNLRLGASVIADCVNAASISRTAWAAVAEECSRPYLFVEVVCSDESEHRRRISMRVADIAGHVLPSWEAVQSIPMEPAPLGCLSIDTSRLSPDAAVDLICKRAAGWLHVRRFVDRSGV